MQTRLVMLYIYSVGCCSSFFPSNIILSLSENTNSMLLLLYIFVICLVIHLAICLSLSLSHLRLVVCHLYILCCCCFLSNCIEHIAKISSKRTRFEETHTQWKWWDEAKLSRISIRWTEFILFLKQTIVAISCICIYLSWLCSRRTHPKKTLCVCRMFFSLLNFHSLF